MIRAYINSEELKLYSDIAIGLTIENFDLSDLANRKIDRTNTIKVPKAGNETVFEFSSLPNAPTTFAYDDYDFDLLVDGQVIYQNAKAFIIRDDDESYYLNITYGLDIINQMKGISLSTLFAGQQITIGNVAALIANIIAGTNGIKIDYLYNPHEVVYCAANANSYYWYIGESFLSMYISIIFARVTTVHGITFAGDLMADAEFLKLRIPLVAGLLKLPFGAANVVASDMIINNSLNFYDLFKIVVQLFGAVFKISGSTVTIQKFDDIDVTTPLDWSGKMISKSKSFVIDNTGQNNLIRYTPQEDVADSYLQTTLVCNNLRLDKEVELFQIASNIYRFVDISGYYATSNGSGIDLPDFSIRSLFLIAIGGSQYIEKSLEKLVILDDDTDVISTGTINITIEYLFQPLPPAWAKTNVNNGVFGATLTLPKYYDFSGNFTQIAAILTDTVVYDCEILLNLVDIMQFDPFKAIQIDELEGLFYVNKIQDFLTTAPGTPTKVQLIKLS